MILNWKVHLGVGALLGAALLGTGALAADFPDPSDEAALYEEAKKEGTIVWYQTGPAEAFDAIAAEFEKKYPGIRVQQQRASGTAGTRRFMQETEAGQYLADNLNMSDREGLAEMIRLGYMAEWRVPTADRLPEEAKMGDYAFSPVVTVTAIIYNKNKVTPEEVKLLETGWKGILDPRFKGRFTITNSNTGASYGPLNLFFAPEYKDEFGEQFLRDVVANQPVLYTDNVVAFDRVIAGEQDIQFWGWEALGISKWEDGAPIRWVYPKPTPAYHNNWMTISKFAPHPHAARLFQNWLMSEDGARAIEQHYGAKAVLEGHKDTRSFAAEEWLRPPVEYYSLDMKRWSEEFDASLALWHKIQREGHLAARPN